MIRDIENKFFREFQIDGVAIMSLHIMQWKYCGIGNETAVIYKESPEDVINFIQQRTESCGAWPFYGIENNSPLMDEIFDNLATRLDILERDAYIEEILRKFQMWHWLYSLSKDKLDNLCDSVKLNSVEYFFHRWNNAFDSFARKFSVILAKHGINILEIQNRSGFKIIERLDLDDLWMDFGSRESAKYHLEKLNVTPKEIPKELTSTQAQSVLQRGTDIGLFDDKFMPLPQMTKAQKKVFAIHCATECGFKDRCYKPFEEYWQISNLAQVREVDSNPNKLEIIKNLFSEEIQEQAKRKYE